MQIGLRRFCNHTHITSVNLHFDKQAVQVGRAKNVKKLIISAIVGMESIGNLSSTSQRQVTKHTTPSPAIYASQRGCGPP